MSVSSFVREREYTVTMGKRVRVVSVRKVDWAGYKYLVELEEIEDDERVTPNIIFIFGLNALAFLRLGPGDVGAQLASLEFLSAVFTEKGGAGV